MVRLLHRAPWVQWLAIGSQAKKTSLRVVTVHKLSHNRQSTTPSERRGLSAYRNRSWCTCCPQTHWRIISTTSPRSVLGSSSPDTLSTRTWQAPQQRLGSSNAACRIIVVTDKYVNAQRSPPSLLVVMSRSRNSAHVVLNPRARFTSPPFLKDADVIDARVHVTVEMWKLEEKA